MLGQVLNSPSFKIKCKILIIRTSKGHTEAKVEGKKGNKIRKSAAISQNAREKFFFIKISVIRSIVHLD